MENSYIIKNGPTVERFNVRGTLFCPYHNRWGQVAYYLDSAFDHDPFHILALSTSGSPVLMDEEGQFFGFLSDEVEDGCSFQYDGQSTLTVHVPAGQRLFVDLSGDGDEAWKTYNGLILSKQGMSEAPRDHWALPEYCTWVEQKRFAEAQGRKPGEVISEAFVDEFMRRIDQLGLPPGKLTLDDGWTPGNSGFGDWLPDESRFPSMEKLAGNMARAGYVPGLWFAPVWVHEQCRTAAKHPEWIGAPRVNFTGELNIQASKDRAKDPLHYWAPREELEDYFSGMFGRYINMGFRKFKLDMAYGEKTVMKKLHAMMYRAVKKIDPDVEMEIHQPDIFFSRFGDSIRTNDVLCNDTRDWRGLTRSHFEVCYKSSPGKVINLDHVGGNDPNVTDADFLEHIEMYRPACGYPVISLLPDRHGKLCQDALRDYVQSCITQPNVVSDFFKINESSLSDLVIGQGAPETEGHDA